jgi:hypothetical protein
MSRTRAQYVRPLTDAERRVLQDSLRSSEAFVARRAQIVLASAAGERSEQIAPCVGGTTHGVRAVIRAFNARGLDALRPGSHHPDVVSTVDAPQSEAPRDLLHQSPHLCDTGGTASNVWTLERAAVAQEQGVTAEGGSDVTIRTTLAQMDVRWPQTREWTTSPDREYARNKARCTSLIRLAQRHPDWLLGCAEEVWWSGVSHPALHTWQDDGKAWRTMAPDGADRSGPVAQERPALTGLRALFWDALLPFGATRLVLVLVGLLANSLLVLRWGANLPHRPLATPSSLPDALWLIWQRFDSGFYLAIAQHGYGSVISLHHASNWVFYPLFPVLIQPVAHLLGGSAGAFGIAGVLVANVAALVAVIFLYKLVRREFGAVIAARAVLYLAVFPTSFYLSAVYAESLLLACSVACLYYARGRRWWLAGLCGGAAALARPPGVLLLVPLAWEYGQALRDRPARPPVGSPASRRGRTRLRVLAHPHESLAVARAPRTLLRTVLCLPALALVPAGLYAFMAYAQLKTGDFWASPRNEYLHWGRRPTYPWDTLAVAFRHPQGVDLTNWNFWILNVAMAVAFLLLTVWAFRTLRMTYALYMLLMVLLPLSTGSLNSISRYYLVIFPIVVLLALWSNRDLRLTRHHCVVCLFASVQAMFMVFFVLGLPAIA